MRKREKQAARPRTAVLWILAAFALILGIGVPCSALFDKDDGIATADEIVVETPTEEEIALEQQAITVSPEADESVVVTLDGMMPVDAEVLVQSGDSSPQETICAYDITIRDTEGNVFQPQDDAPIRVGITNSAIAAADRTQLHLWHIDDSGIRTEIRHFRVDGDTIIFDADGFSLYEVTDNNVALCTYEFYLQGEDGVYRKYYYNSSTGKQLCQQIVKQSETLTVPQLPAQVTADEDETNPTFVGWYLLEESGNTLTATETRLDFKDLSETFQAGDTVCVGAVFSDCAYLIFHDQKNTKTESYPIVGTRRGVLVDGSAEVAIGGLEVTYDDDTQEGQEGTRHMVFAGWSETYIEPGTPIETDPNSENYVEIYRSGDTVTIEKNTELYPVFKEIAWLTFATGEKGGGASFVQPRSVEIDEVITSLSVPTWRGYTFGGWYADEDRTDYQVTDADGNVLANATLPDTLQSTNGGMKVDQDTKLYAKWVPANTDYTVIVWMQSVTGSARPYDFGYSEHKTATTESTVTVDSDYTRLDYEGFHYDHCDEGKTVAPDGSTILNVYYNRNEHIFTFKVNNKTVKTVTALYGDRIADVFPIIGDNGTSYEGYYWSDSSGRVYTYILQTIDVMPDADVTFKGTSSGTTKTIYYYVEIDEEDAANYASTRDFNGGLYGLYKTVRHNFRFITYDEEYHPLEGYLRDRDWASPSFDTDNQARIGTGNINYLYYKRETFNAEFVTDDEQINREIQYDQRLVKFVPDDPTPPAGHVFRGWYADDTLKVRVFFSEPTQEEIDSTKDENDVPQYVIYERMPAHNLRFYAAYDPIEYLVQFDPNGGKFETDPSTDNSGYSTWFYADYEETVAEPAASRNYIVSPRGTYYYCCQDRAYHGLGPNEKGEGLPRNAFYTTDISLATDLSQKYEYSSGAYRYAGWYRVYDDGREELFNFGTKVTEPITLRLHWKALGTYYIKYDPGEGKLDTNDSNEEQFEILDKHDYADGAQVVVTRTVEQPPAGKNFIGWKIKNDPTGQIYYPGGTFDFNGALSEIEVQDDGSEKRYMVLEAVYQTVGGTMTSEADHGTGTFLENVIKDGSGQNVEVPLTDAEKYDYDTVNGRLTVSNLVNNTKVTLSKGTGFSNGNFKFAGWNTKPDGSGTPFTDKEAEGIQYYINTAPDDPITLYAMWEVPVYFDKNNDPSLSHWTSEGEDSWDSPYKKYVDEEGGVQYYTTVLLNAKLDEPPYIPSSDRPYPDEEMFQFWSLRQLRLYDDNDVFYFNDTPITQELLDGKDHLTLYAIWDSPIRIPVHAVDSSSEILELKDEWRYPGKEIITINSNTTVEIGDEDTARSYADPKKQFPGQNDPKYTFAFACVSDTKDHVSEANKIKNIYYDRQERYTYVEYEDGRKEPFPEGNEVYLVYYRDPAEVPIRYAEMGTNGALTYLDTETNNSVAEAAPKTADVSNDYTMGAQVTKPREWVNNAYRYYSFAIGDRNANDASKLHIITAPSNSDGDGDRPNLHVRDTWRGFQYSTDGQTWTNAGYNIELYVVYYDVEPSVLTLEEKTIGSRDDMDKEFTYHVTISETETEKTTTNYYYKDGNTLRPLSILIPSFILPPVAIFHRIPKRTTSSRMMLRIALRKTSLRTISHYQMAKKNRLRYSAVVQLQRFRRKHFQTRMEKNCIIKLGKEHGLSHFMSMCITPSTWRPPLPPSPPKPSPSPKSATSTSPRPSQTRPRIPRIPNATEPSTPIP